MKHTPQGSAPAPPSPADLKAGAMPPWVRRIIKTCGRGINSFQMIRDGEKILLGVSGGKDSLALALCLSLRRRWLPIHYDLEALQIDWREYPLSSEEKEKLTAYFAALEIPLTFKPVSMFPGTFKKGGFNCYQCSRNRKRVLFDEAKDRGIRKIALGHHQDDIVETTLLNLIYHGRFSTMMPVQDFFDGEVQIIRPLCQVTEKEVRRLTTRLTEIPVTEIGCPYKETNIRSQLKPLIAQMCRITKQARENIYRAPWKIDAEYLPGPLQDDQKTSKLSSEGGCRHDDS